MGSETSEGVRQMEMIVTDRIILHRRETRRTNIVNCFFTRMGIGRVYQVIGFASYPADFQHREELGVGTQQEMRRLLRHTAAQLCQDGFFVCDENA